MKILLKKAVIHTGNADLSTRKDILIEDGIITQISKSISDGKATIIESRNLHVSPGWLDIGAQPGQPGFEYRETYHSLAQSARAGGYTALATFPRTQPAIQSRVGIEYILKLAAQLPVHILPVGAVSAELEGRDLTEMIDMLHAGAVAFSDGRKNPLETGLLTRALEYILPYKTVIIDFPLDRSLTADGQMHEGKISASMGLTGIPTVAEDITVSRDIKLAAYTGSRLHFHAVSSPTSLQYIQKAKSDKLQITCDIPAIHLLMEDTAVMDFDSHKKVLPPLRDSKTRKALIKAIKDGIVDHISSIHTPMEVETKECEYTYAAFGTIGLETAFAAANTAMYGAVPVESIVRTLYAGSRKALFLEIPVIEKNQPAELTFFDPDAEWQYTGTTRSLSKNDALTGMKFTGKVVGTLARGELLIN